MKVKIEYLDEVFKITYNKKILHAGNNLSSHEETVEYATKLAKEVENNLESILQSFEPEPEEPITKQDITKIQSTVDYIAMMAE